MAISQLTIDNTFLSVLGCSKAVLMLYFYVHKLDIPFVRRKVNITYKT